MRVMITGVNGFIGSHLLGLLAEDQSLSILGIDVMNTLPYGGVWKNRICFAKCNILDRHHLSELFEQWQPHIVFHLAAKLGVDDVIKQPGQTISENVVGTMNVAELCKSPH